MTPDQLIHKLGMQLGESLTEEDQYEIEQHTNGRELEHLTTQEGWQIVVNMLRSYSDKATADLLRLEPGHPAVPQAHAAAAALTAIVTTFLYDVDQAIQRGREIPDVVRKAFVTTSGIPPEIM